MEGDIPEEVYLLADVIVNLLIERMNEGEIAVKCPKCGENMELVAANTEE